MSGRQGTLLQPFRRKRRRTRDYTTSAATAASCANNVGTAPGLLQGGSRMTPSARESAKEAYADASSGSTATAKGYVARPGAPFRGWMPPRIDLGLSASLLPRHGLGLP